MSCCGIGSGISITNRCWNSESATKVELVCLGLGNLLFLAGAAYMAYMSHLQGSAFCATPEFWGFLIPNVMMCTSFFIMVMKDKIFEEKNR